MKRLILIHALILTAIMTAQTEDKLPYHNIEEYPETYTQGTVVARMVDGLGFRYYWATEDLRPEDLSYRPSESGRTSSETIEHLYGLSNFILKSISSNESKQKGSEMTFEGIRTQTLFNFKKASDILKATDDVSQFDNDRYPFWNVINGPIADALWHCGQIVMLRRASGNPFNSKVSVFQGKLRE